VAPHGASGTISRHRLGASREHVERLAGGPATLVTFADLVGFPSRPGAHRARSTYAFGSRRALREGGGPCLPALGALRDDGHKSQGSQFDTAAVVLPSRASPVLARELLDTAVTGARASLILAGTEEAVRAAVARPAARASGLRRRLWGNVGR